MIEQIVVPEVLPVPFASILGEGPVWLGETPARVDTIDRRPHQAGLDAHDHVGHDRVDHPTSRCFAGGDRSLLAFTTDRLAELGHRRELDGPVPLIPTQNTGPASTPAVH